MKTRWMLAMLLFPSLGVVLAQSPPSRPAFAEPGISPDGSEIAFVSGGDIWTVAATGGTARLLVSHPATESRPLFSPDGRRLAFTSTRTGSGDIYVLTLESGELKRVTYDDTPELVSGWSPDGQWIYFDSSAIDVGTPANTDVFRVRSTGGTPMPVSADRYIPEYYAAAAPDGVTIAMNARGFAGNQWWRKGHSHLDESEIWLRKGDAYTRVTEGGAKDAWPLWQADGNGLLYVSDRGGAQNIWQRELGSTAKARQVTNFRNGRVLWPSISRDGRTVVFERDFQIWKLDARSGQSAQVEIRRQGVPAGPSTRRISLGGEWRDLALSPDGKKVALVGHGELFVAARDGGDAVRITRTPGLEVQPAWSSDSARLVYASDRGGQPRIYEYDVAAGIEKALTAGPDTSPAFSKDGRRLAFVRNDTELRVLDWETKQERAVAQLDAAAPFIIRENDDAPYVWSPDGRWLAFVDTTHGETANLKIADATGATPARQVTFLANGNASFVNWAADGTALFFRTGTRTETFRAARVDLVPRTPQFRENQVLDLFRTPGKSNTSAGPEALQLDDVRNRLTLLPTGIDVSGLRVSPDAKVAVLKSTATGQSNLYAYSIDPLSRDASVARQLTATAGNKTAITFTPDGKEVLYLERGVLQSVPADGGRGPRAIAVNADMEVDFHQEKLEVFREGWSYLRDYFAFPDMNGVNWAGVRETYEPLVQGAATPDEMRRLMQLMLGELNASHLNAAAPGAGGSSTGRLGLRFDRAQYEQSGAFVVTEVVPLSPAAVAGVKTGDRLVAVNGTTLEAASNLEQLLDSTIGRQVKLKLADREVAALPVDIGAERALAYRAWVERNRAYVDKASGGRLGYVHLQSMAAEIIDRLNVDLDTNNHSRDGIVIDIRANTGGFIAAHALDVFNRKAYITIQQRGRPASASIQLWAGSRSIGKPTILLVNQASLSDAEDFTEGYRNLKMGSIVGEPTAGWFISTGNLALIDGTTFRIPGAQGFAANGENLEMHPRPVDVTVSRPIGESYTARDSQLDVAVKTLLSQLRK